MIVVARYLKGCKMLERYEVKVSRTVLRRGGASNRFLLSLRFNPGNNLKNVSLEIKPQRSRRGTERGCLEPQNISTKKLLLFRLIMRGYLGDHQTQQRS